MFLSLKKNLKANIFEVIKHRGVLKETIFCKAFCAASSLLSTLVSFGQKNAFLRLAVSPEDLFIINDGGRTFRNVLGVINLQLMSNNKTKGTLLGVGSYPHSILHRQVTNETSIIKTTKKDSKFFHTDVLLCKSVNLVLK